MDQLTDAEPRSAARFSVTAPSQDGMRRVIAAGLLTATVLVGLHAVTQLLDFRVFNLQVRAINADKHDSIFGVASLLAQAGVAVASVWRARAGGRHRRAWLVLAALVASLVLVRVLVSYNTSMLAVPLACLFALLCWLTWRDALAARTVVWAGLILMLLSLSLHEIGPDADSSLASDFTWSYQITGVVKHGCELAGWILVATGIAAAVRARRA
jgi:hypothetical protein